MQVFTAPDAWKGGYYELLICPLAHFPEVPCSALKALWTFPSLRGCYLRRDLSPSAQARVTPCERGTEERLYGVATLPNQRLVSCGSYETIAHSDNLHWIGFYLPLGSLTEAYPIGSYPFGSTDRVSEWMPEINAFLADIARWIHEKVPISIAVVGFEVNLANVSPEKIRTQGIQLERNEGILWNDGTDLG